MHSASLATDEHQRLVRKLMEFFEDMGLVVTCASSGYVHCSSLKNFEPDVRARDFKNELNYIGEAKTCDDLTSKYTKDQLKEFANREMIRGKSKGKLVPLYIMVPDQCRKELYRVLDEIGLSKQENIHIL